MWSHITKHAVIVCLHISNHKGGHELASARHKVMVKRNPTWPDSLPSSNNTSKRKTVWLLFPHWLPECHTDKNLIHQAGSRRPWNGNISRSTYSLSLLCNNVLFPVTYKNYIFYNNNVMNFEEGPRTERKLQKAHHWYRVLPAWDSTLSICMCT